jgi:uncharacterized protein YaiE (UPF0345 family)
MFETVTQPQGEIDWTNPGPIGSGNPSTGRFLYLTLDNQLIPPAVPAAALNLFADSANRLAWIDTDGFVAALNSTGITGNRIWTLPDASGTVALLDAVQTFSNKTLTTPAIGDYSNAGHNHQNAAGGDTLTTAAIASGTFADSFIPSLNASKITAGDLAAARIAAALAGGTLPFSGTTIAGTTATFTSNGIFGPAGAALGDARVVVNAAASTKGIIARASSTGTANIQEWQNSSGTALTGVTSTGGIFLTTLAQFLNGAATGSLTYNSNGTLEYTSSSATINFSISGATNPQIRVTDTTNTVTAKFQSLDTFAYVGVESAHALSFITNNAARLTLGASGGFTVTDANDFAFGTTTGTKFGTSVSQKLSFWNAPPVVQPSGAAQAAVSTTPATNVSPYGFATQAQADAIITLLNELRRCGVLTGAMKGSA